MRLRAVPAPLLATLVALPLGAPPGAAQVSLSAAARDAQCVVTLHRPPAAVVVERHTAPLPAGEAEVAVQWGSTRLNTDSLALVSLSPGVDVGPLRFPPERPGTACWSVQAQAAGTAEFDLSYLLDGLSWEPVHLLTVNEQAGTFDLETGAALRNDSGREFRGVRITLAPDGPAAPASPLLEALDLGVGEMIQVPYVALRGVRFEPRLVYDSAAGEATTRQLVTRNSPELGLPGTPLPGGKVRLFRAADGPAAFVGEAMLPDVLPQEELTLPLGTAKEVEVDRRVLSTREVDHQRDVHGRTALYNIEEEISVTIRNRTDQAVVLHVRGSIPGEWEMKSTSHEYIRKDAASIEFLVPVEPHQQAELRYRYKRLNLIP